MHTSVGKIKCSPPATAAAASSVGIQQQDVTGAGGDGGGGASGKKRSVLWKTAVGFGAGAAIGLVIGYDQLRRSRQTVANTTDQNPIVLQAVPDVKASRSVSHLSKCLESSLCEADCV
jgi:hypothetical protein